MLFIKRMWGLILPILIVAMSPPLFHATGYQHYARIGPLMGFLLVFVGAIIYVIFVDSKKRWPGVGWFQRWTRFITLQR